MPALNLRVPEVTSPQFIYEDGGTSLYYNADFSDPGLTIDGDLVLAVSNGGAWIGGDVNMGSVFTVPESDAYAVQLTGAGGFELVVDVAPVPVPAALWLFGTGLLGLVGVARRRA